DEELQQRDGLARLHVDPGCPAVVGERQVVLDVALRAQYQSFPCRARLEPLQILRSQVLQPAEPVGAGDPEHAAVRPAGHAEPARDAPLLGERVAVVRRDARVDPIGWDGSGCREQRAGHEPEGRLRRWTATFPLLISRCYARQAEQMPKTVRCPTSVRKPW